MSTPAGAAAGSAERPLDECRPAFLKRLIRKVMAGARSTTPSVTVVPCCTCTEKQDDHPVRQGVHGLQPPPFRSIFHFFLMIVVRPDDKRGNEKNTLFITAKTLFSFLVFFCPGINPFIIWYEPKGQALDPLPPQTAGNVTPPSKSFNMRTLEGGFKAADTVQAVCQDPAGTFSRQDRLRSFPGPPMLLRSLIQGGLCV